MSLKTAWGYSIEDDDLPEEMLSVSDYDNMTANKYSGDTRIRPNIAAASAAIRDFCGWHVYPSKECSVSEYMLYGNGRVKMIGRDIMIQLPATIVTEVSSVTIDETELSDFAFDENGTVHVFDVPFYMISRKSKLTVVYTAGLRDVMMNGIKDLIASRVTRSLASTAGVQSESAGGVSISYSSAWLNSDGAGSLPDESRDQLLPYKVMGVF